MAAEICDLLVPRAPFLRVFNRLEETHPRRKFNTRKDCIAVFLNYVALHTFHGKVTLNVEKMIKLVGERLFSKIRDTWIELGYGTPIGGEHTQNGSYRAGEYARSYRVRKTNKCVQHTLTDKNAIKRWREFYTVSPADTVNPADSEPIPSLALPQQEFLQSGRISFVPEIAERIFNSRGNRGVEMNRLRLLCHPDSGGWMKTDRHSARIFHHASNLPREYRSALRFDGDPIVEVDVSNCMLLLTALQMSEDDHPLFDDQFLRDAREAVIYEKIMQATGRDRESTKTGLLVAMNTTDGTQFHMPEWKAFKRIYPNAHGWIEYNKELGSGLYRVYSSAESKLIFPVVNNLLERGIPALSIHDAVLTTERHATITQDLLEESSSGRVSIKRFDAPSN